MKNYINLIFVCLFIFSGCKEDNPPSPGAGYLSVSTTLQPVQTKAIIEEFTLDDKLGLFITTSGDITDPYKGDQEYLNLPAVYNGANWSHKAVEINDKPAIVLSYYPYTDNIIDREKININLSDQTDHLYGRSGSLSKNYPKAHLQMKHSQALVSFIIKRNDYQYGGQVTKVELDGIQLQGTMDITSGEIVKSGSIGKLAEDRDYILDDDNLKKTGLIVLPTDISQTSGVKITITIDGNECTYDVPVSHNWEPGYEYIYTLNMRKMTGPIEPDDVELDIEYWTYYGKDDKITLGSNSGFDIRMSPNFERYGRTLVRGEGGYLGVFVQNRGSEFEGKLRMSLWEGETMIEQYQPYNVKAEATNIGGWLIPCYIDCPAGIYQLRPLFQPKGSTEWIYPRYMGGYEDEDWLYTVIDHTNTPACRSINLKGELGGSSRIYTVNKNQPFIMEYILSNRAGVALNGEIKAVWERTFGEFYPSWANDGNTWFDEIGRVRIDLTGDTRYFSGEIECTISTSRIYPNSNVPIIHFYYRADGSDTWELMRVDCNNTLERAKDITDYYIWGTDEDGDRFLIGGLQMVYNQYPSSNFYYVMPE